MKAARQTNHRKQVFNKISPVLKINKTSVNEINANKTVAEAAQHNNLSHTKNRKKLSTNKKIIEAVTTMQVTRAVEEAKQPPPLQTTRPNRSIKKSKTTITITTTASRTMTTINEDVPAKLFT